MIKTLLIIGVLFLGTNSSLACSCQEPGSVEESFEYSDAVFHRKVVSKTSVTFSESIRSEIADSIRQNVNERKQTLFDSEFIVAVEFEIITYYKGNLISDTVVIYTTRTSASCGSHFEIGKEYLVYGSSKSYAIWTFLHSDDDVAPEKPNTFWTNHCTRTNEYDYAEAKELEKLIE